ncbi:sensor domain-containing diguanylate cyclase [Alteromonas oceanisediminis]|uniref:sensor domain-containing diguanylate cyclase n=1 Tax=Alteromonas oceanisediminis TaxID=2836180 RepID=UPI001BDACF86|nr:diguanylate cyclase [Alteromonas oceanisediminis]MBT0586283.1 GGDEF domain-containing protein [Alteromonas oceanisediminis]
MSIFRTLHRSILVLFAVVVISIVTLVHFSISKIVAEQSRAQQASMSPAIDLIIDQLIQPLHIAETLSKSRELVDLMDVTENDPLVPEDAFRMLKRLENEFGMIFFIASEVNRQQYNSDGSTIDLIEGEVNWYFKYRDAERNAVADIGKWEDTHFYIDLKIYNNDGKFLGFFGVGKALRSFLTVFDSYKREHGYDFIFVDDNDNITLSSDSTLIAEYSEFKTLEDLLWYQRLEPEIKQEKTLNNQLVSIEGNDFLIAEIDLEQFDWTLYLLSPLDARQTEISRGFIASVVTLLVIIFVLFLLIYNILYYFRQDMQTNTLQYAPSRLPDRIVIEEKFNNLIDARHTVAVIIIDIDNFTSINDTYGRNVGDQVLDSFTAYLGHQIRSKDILGRWSSEEFIILLPDTGPHEAFDMAQDIRQGIEEISPPAAHPNIRLTASFGVSYTATPRAMSEVTANADDALYQAKREGSNLVRMQLID